MKKRNRILLVALAVLFAAGAIIYLSIPKEPRYQGRTFSQWLGDYSLASQQPDSENNPKRKAATNALLQIGTSSIPWLLKLASVNESKPKEKIISWINSHPSLHLHIQPYSDRFEIARAGLELLGNKAKPVWPVLIQWTYDKDPHRRIQGLLLLINVHADKATLMPICLRLINDPDEQVQGVTIQLFDEYSPEDMIAALRKEEQNSKPAQTNQSTTNQPAPKK